MTAIKLQSLIRKFYITATFFAVMFLFSPLTNKALAATLYWVGSDGANASVASNWKTTNPASCGGGDAGAAPGASDAVVFDPDCDNGASIDSGFASTITSVNMNTGYSGVVTLARSLQTTSTFTQSGGVFNAVSFALDVDSTFTMDTGATFRASSGTMTFAGSFTINGGTFDKDTNSGGTVTFDGSTAATLTCNSITFNVVNFSKTAGTNSITVGSTCTIPISGTNPSSTGYVTNNGIINITGNWTIAGKYISNTGATLNMTGTTLTINGPIGGTGTLTMNGGTFPAGVTAITIDNGSLLTSGNLIPNGIDLTITGSGNFSATCGNETWNSVTLSRSVSNTFTINSGCSFPIAGTNPTSTGVIVNNGIISTNGNWTVTAYTANTGSQLIMTGTSFSTSFGDLILNGGTFPSGITTLTVASGSLDNTGNLLPNGIDLTMSGSFVATVTCGTAQFNSLTINKSGTAARAVDNCTVGDFTLTAGGFSNPTSPVTYNITGNFSHVSTTLGGANLTMEFSGSNTQTLSKTGGTFSSIFKVNKTGTNALSLITDFSTSGQTCTVAAGIFDLNGYPFSCGSTFTIQNGGSLRIFGHENPTTPVLNSGSTVIYKGNGDSAGNGYIPKSWSYKNVTAAFTDSGDYLGGSSSDSLPNNLVGYWKMDEGSGSQVDDSSTNSNIGNITNAIFSSTVQALDISNPYSLDFDGSGDYLDMGNNLSIAQSVSVFSIAAWIRKDTISGVDQVFGLSTGTSTSNSRAHLATNGDEVECIARAGDAEAGQTRTTTASNLVTGTWYHIACNIDYANDTISIYVNGALANSTGTIAFTATSTSNTASQRSSIGIDEDKVGNDFDGQIDEVRVYNRLLTQSEIEALGTAYTTMVVPSLSVSGNVLISSGSIVSPTTFNIGGNFTNNATFTHNSGTVVFNGTSGTKTLTSGGTSFYNLTLNDGGGSLTLELQDALDINGDLTITGGTLDTKFGGNNQINLFGNWNNSDTFTARSGIVILDGGNQTISGATTFNSLTKNITTPARTLTFPAGVTQTITGTLTLSGTSGNLLSLRSSSAPTQWQIDPQSTRTLSYLDVKDSYNINSTFIETSGNNITNSFNNTGWNFSTPSSTTPSSITQATNGTGYITFSTTVSDSDSQNTKLKVEYSDDGGTSWYDPILVSASAYSGSADLNNSNPYQIGTSNPIDTSGGAVTLDVTWDTKSALNGNGTLNNSDQSDIKLRVTANDSGTDGTAATSSAFEVDNVNPTTFSSFSASSHTSSTVTLSFSTVTETNFNHYEIWYGTNQSDVEGRTGTASEWDNADDANLSTISTSTTTITGLTVGSTYYFRAWAVDNFGNESNSSTISDTPNTPPSATSPSSISQATDDSGYITFNTTISDADLHNTKLKIEYSDDGGTSWYDPILVSASAYSGSVDLNNSNPYQVGTVNPIDTASGAVTLTIVWGTVSSSNGNGTLDNTDQSDIRLRVTPNDSIEDGTPALSSAFEVDNVNPTTFSSFSASSHTGSTVTLSFSPVTETNFNHYEIWYGTNQSDVEGRTGTASEWDNADDANLSIISTSSTTITGLTAGSTYYFRAWAVDNFGNESNSPTITDIPNTPSSATSPSSISQATDGTGYITFATTISDSDSQDTRLKVEYSDDAGTSWYDPVLVSVSPSSGSVDLNNSNPYQVGTVNPIDTASGAVTLTIVWDTISSSNGNGTLDNTDQSDIRLRVTPNDSIEDGTPALSSAFEVDNVNPSGPSGLAATATSTAAQLTWTSATESNFDHYEIWYGTSQSDVEGRTGTASEWDNDNDTDLANVSTTSTTISGLTTNSTYYFRIWAVDDFGNETYATTISKRITGSTSTDTTDPDKFDLTSPENKTYTNETRPTFKWEASDDDGGLDSYSFKIDNGNSGDFEIKNITPTGTRDKKKAGYTISYSGFDTSSMTDDRVSIRTRSSSSWDSDENDGKLKEGLRRWTVKAIDETGNDRTESSTLFVDLTTPKLSLDKIESASLVDNFANITNQNPTFYGRITDPLSGDSEANKVASGPKETILTIERKGTLGIYTVFSISNISVTKTYFSSDSSEINDNTKNTSDKYSNFVYTMNEEMPYGEYRLTLTGKDNVGNESTPSVYYLIVSEPAPTPIPAPTPTPITETGTESSTTSPTAPPTISSTTQPPATSIIEETVSTIVDTVSNVYWGVVDTIEALANPIIEGIADAIQSLPSEITEVVSNLLSPIQPFIDQLAENIVITTEVWFDKEPTMITDVKVLELGANYAVIYWNTNHYATGKVNYGLSYDYGSNVYSYDKTTEHKLLITDLKPGTKYYYEVMSQNKNYVFDARHEFETKTEGSTAPPLESAKKKESIKPTLAKKTVDSLKETPIVGATIGAADKILEKEETSQVLLTISIFLMILPTLLNVFEVYVPLMTKIPVFNLPFAVFGLLKKIRNPWGVVYDSTTKQPLDPVIVTLKNLQNNKTTQRVSDIYGRYEFITEPGEYTITTEKTNYSFPSKILSNRMSDEVYEDIYLGGLFTIKPFQKVNFNIPMDNVGRDWNEEEKKRLKITTRSKSLYKASSLFYKLGFSISLLAYLVYPTLSNLSMIFLFAVIFFLRRIVVKIKPWGIVLDKNGNPVSNALVRLINMNIPNLKLPPIVTNVLGRFNFLVYKGTYQITVSLKQDDGTYRELYKSRPIVVAGKYGQANENVVLG